MPVEWRPGRIVPERWRSVLLPLDSARRMEATRSARLVMAERSAAVGVVIELPPPPSVPTGGRAVKVADPPGPAQSSTRQANVRISHAEHHLDG